MAPAPSPRSALAAIRAADQYANDMQMASGFSGFVFDKKMKEIWRWVTTSVCRCFIAAINVGGFLGLKWANNPVLDVVVRPVTVARSGGSNQRMQTL